MKFQDYYETLGVERGASQDEIKKAYRRLARKFHPDVSTESDAEARFKSLGEAYEVLKDPEKRAAYDQLGKNWQAGQQFEAPSGWDAGFEFSGGDFTGAAGGDFSDFFESLFGRGGGPQHTSRRYRGRGEDHHARILIDLEDAFTGATRELVLRVPEVGATGHVQTRERKLSVKIPKGIRPGQRIRLAGQGAVSFGEGPPGDLYLEVLFRDHARYTADDSDLYLSLPVSPWEAALGATIKTPTPAGTVDLKIPAGSAAGRKLRLRGRGLPGDPPGDLYAVLQIVVPPADSDEIKALYKEMSEKSSFDPRAALGV